MGGDVNHVALDLLPRPRQGVLVHFHDIFLPWEYPRKWAEDYGSLLERAVPVAGVPEHDDRFEILHPSWRDGAAPGAFWIRRR
jgi:hypothetical protein